MRSAFRNPFGPLLVCMAGLLALPAPAHADLAVDVSALRSNGCGKALEPLHRDARLDEAARASAQGSSLHDALAHSGYLANSSALLHASGSGRAVREVLRTSGCNAIENADFADVGIYARGQEAWIVLAQPYRLPSAADSAQFAADTLRRVNEARARGARCGKRSMPPARPLQVSATLEAAAAGHARDMAMRDYFDHYDREGRSPAERAQAAGYRESMVGENIAYGPATPEEVVDGWLHSPEHCANMLEARFTEMGVAFAVGHGERRPGLFWVQELGLPAP
jgi:uncharacterized protein YkwD